MYFDYAATTPMSSAALNVYTQTAQQYYGNTESKHQPGRAASQLLEHCRGVFSDLTKCPKDSLLFTSGGTESNQLALNLSLNLLPENKREILVSPLEHSSILHLLMANPTITVKKLVLDSAGKITPEALTNQISQKTGLIIIQQINSVTGITQEITPLARLARDRKILFHCDCVQSFGKIPLPQDVTSFSAASHKIYGPKGCGLLYLDPKISFQGLYPGTAQEHGLRGGTTDLPAIAAFTQAAKDSFEKSSAILAHYRNLQQTLTADLSDWQILTGDFPGITGVFSPSMGASDLVSLLDEKGFFLSTTSACNSRELVDPSLAALNIPKADADRYFRVSFGQETTTADVTALAAALKSLA